MRYVRGFHALSMYRNLIRTHGIKLLKMVNLYLQLYVD